MRKLSRPLTGQAGSATVEFVLITALLLILFLGALHLALALHIRNLAQDAAVHGARYAALADRTPQDGLRRTKELLTGSLNGSIAPRISARGTDAGTQGSVTVTVKAAVPLLGFLPGPHLITAEATSRRTGA